MLFLSRVIFFNGRSQDAHESETQTGVDLLLKSNKRLIVDDIEAYEDDEDDD